MAQTQERGRSQITVRPEVRELLDELLGKRIVVVVHDHVLSDPIHLGLVLGGAHYREGDGIAWLEVPIPGLLVTQAHQANPGWHSRLTARSTVLKLYYTRNATVMMDLDQTLPLVRLRARGFLNGDWQLLD